MEAYEDLLRQYQHWQYAIDRLGKLEEFASAHAWQRIEQYTGEALRTTLTHAVNALRQTAHTYRQALQQAGSNAPLGQHRLHLRQLRQQYLKTETTLDFYGDALTARSSEYTAALLTACDVLARMSMHRLLHSLGKPSPPVLCYIDKGLGASILKAGLRLWDRQTISPVAAIKVVRHNIFRPTSLIHEAGHQVAHLLGWNEQLATTLLAAFPRQHARFARVWAGWASEIAADAYAFVHAGYASIAALHDVLAGRSGFVFNYHPGDPHPISYLRVLLGVEMCRLSYGDGPWDTLARHWQAAYPLKNLSAELTDLIGWSVPQLPSIAARVLQQPLACFRQQGLVQRLPPQRVSPSALSAFGQSLSQEHLDNPAYLLQHCLSLLSYYGYQIATDNTLTSTALRQQEQFMLRLGKHVFTPLNPTTYVSENRKIHELSIA